jgi:hypothetical protein
MTARTVDEYMNDPEMMAALEPIREIHAIRLKHQDKSSAS